MADSIGNYGTAKSYSFSAFAMMTSPVRFDVQDDYVFFLGLHMLVGFATELYLKAILMHYGLSEQELSSKEMGHHLENLNHNTKMFNFESGAANTLVENLHDKHFNFEFRYTKFSAKYNIMPLWKIFSALNVLDAEVEDLLGVSRSIGVERSYDWQLSSQASQWRLPDY